MTDDRPHESLASQGWRVKIILVLASLVVIGSCIATGVALSQEVKPEVVTPILPLNTKADIEWAVEELVRIHDFCFQHQGCTVIAKEERAKERIELETLRREVADLKNGRCT